jgi:CheY-like chemotaxis protein
MRKPRIIICDDDQQILDLFSRILEKMGYEVLTADTPVTCAFYSDQAESCPQHNRCTDILITDNSMPGMTGLELLEIQHQRGCKLTSRNKALITGSADPETTEKAASMGCRVFSKPPDFAELLKWLQECKKRIDLSEPLAVELYQPKTKRSLAA